MNESDTLHFDIVVNGSKQTVTAAAETPLLYVLRDTLHLKGPRFGCGLGQCGACTVLLDGEATRSCVRPIASVGTASIVTLEGLGTAQHPDPLQTAFIQEQAVQCGYCINGMVMTAKGLLRRVAKPTEAQIRAELENNLCRCGTHLRIVKAVLKASEA